VRHARPDKCLPARQLLEDDELHCDAEEVVLEGLSTWWTAQEPTPPAADLERLLALLRWPLLAPESLAEVEAEHPALATTPALSRLLLEGFRFHSAPPTAKRAMRQTHARCRPRAGMLSLLPMLPDGPWEAPAGFAPLPSLASADGLTVPTQGFSFVWNIPHFASLSCLSMYSPAFPVNGHAWKIYVYPKGNNNHHQQLSIYLDSGITDSHEVLAVRFRLVCLNYRHHGSASAVQPMHAVGCAIKEASHSFCKRAKDWGFREFMPLYGTATESNTAGLLDPQAGFLNEGMLSLGVFIENQ